MMAIAYSIIFFRSHGIFFARYLYDGFFRSFKRESKVVFLVPWVFLLFFYYRYVNIKKIKIVLENTKRKRTKVNTYIYFYVTSITSTYIE
jgi:hypothetical protein